MVYGSENKTSPRVRIQSVDTGLFLTRVGAWANAFEAPDDDLCMDPLEAIRLCLRLGIKNVSFTPAAGHGAASVSIYPFGGDPAVKAEQRQLRKMLTEQRRLRSERLALQAKIKALERTQRPRR